MIPLVDVLTRTERYLRERGVDSPRLEAELLLAHVLGVKRLDLYLKFDRPMADEELEKLRPLVARRGKREPMAWILGSVGFHAFDHLAVGPGVLVPRPDTETLVDAALEWVPEGDDPVYVADVGSGSGAVGLAIAHARPHVRVYAIDRAAAALKYTKENRDALGMQSRVAVLEGDLLEAVPPQRPVDVVVSNPPYIPRGQIDGLMPEVSKWEPREALDGGPDGLDVYRKLIPQAAERGARAVLLEVGIHQAPAVGDLLRRAGLAEVRIWNDLAGIARVVGGRKPARSDG